MLLFDIYVDMPFRHAYDMMMPRFRHALRSMSLITDYAAAQLLLTLLRHA